THAGRKIGEQTRIAWSGLETARERLAVLEQAVNLADEVWEMRKKLREAGKATVMDVLDAESDTYTARITYVNASTDMRLAVYQLLQSMGRLTLETTNRHHRKTAPGEPSPAPKPMPNGAG
ncbi:MAG: TolC family protein, partial [Alphaproteobacteria bacterium]|nr:TolC family protein [Alphaproteobacteria bacterium]